MSQPNLTPEQKRQLYRDGYLIIRSAVPREVVERARKTVAEALPKDERRLLVPPQLAGHPDVLALFYGGCVSGLLHTEMGPFPEVISSQVAVIPPGETSAGPPVAHVDGGWSGEIPDSIEEIDLNTMRPKDAARYFGQNDDQRGGNDGQLWMDPERRLSTGSYTALVGVAMNDQLIPGGGQFGVMKGLHHEVRRAFCRQRDSGGIVGPEGLDYPRMRISPSGKPYMNGLFDSVLAEAKRRGDQAEAIEGWPWPELTPILLGQGDAVISVHGLPHTPTPNQGPTPRMSVYFRIRRLRESNPHEGTRRIGHGVSDHPDRGYFGQFLEYPPDYDPWQTSIDKLCDPWSEWDGLREIREQNKATGA